VDGKHDSSFQTSISLLVFLITCDGIRLASSIGGILSLRRILLSQRILEISDLSVRFNTQDGIVNAVNGISYSVSEGETTGIVGESGCGKSVSVLSILRLLPTQTSSVSGSIFFKDKDLLQLPRSEIRQIRGNQIAMIFQDPMTSLNAVLSVGRQLTEALRAHKDVSLKDARDRSIELLQMVGIPFSRNRLDSYPHQLSGGLRQRVMIAMALICNPSLLIADEPTTALDVTIQAQIVDLVKNLRDRLGMSLIWITHDLGVVAGLADRVNVMYAGYIVEKADVYDLYDNPSHPYTLGLLNSLPRIDGKMGNKLNSIDGLPPTLIDLPSGCPFAPRCTFVKDICHQHMPPYFEVEPDHEVACWVNLETHEVRDNAVIT
jgi:oligopeptide transport system ATP-binding protein